MKNLARIRISHPESWGRYTPKGNSPTHLVVRDPPPTRATAPLLARRIGHPRAAFSASFRASTRLDLCQGRPGCGHEGDAWVAAKRNIRRMAAQGPSPGGITAFLP